LIANVRLVDVLALGKSDLQHGNGSAEFKVVKAFDKRLILINDGDVADLVDLVKPLDTVLDELGKVDGRLHGV